MNHVPVDPPPTCTLPPYFPSTLYLTPLKLSLPPPHIPSPYHLCVLPSLCALPLAVKLARSLLSKMLKMSSVKRHPHFRRKKFTKMTGVS